MLIGLLKDQKHKRPVTEGLPAFFFRFLCQQSTVSEYKCIKEFSAMPNYLVKMSFLTTISENKREKNALNQFFAYNYPINSSANMKKIHQISTDNAGNRALTVAGHECGPGIPNFTHFWATWDGFHRIRLEPHPVCKWSEYGEDNTQERGAWTCGYIIVVFGRVFPGPSKAPTLLGSFVV